MNSPAGPSADPIERSVNPSEKFEPIPARNQPGIVVSLHAKAAPSPEAVSGELDRDRLLTAEQVAERLNVTKDWVWDHSSRKSPYLPVILSETARSAFGRARSKNSSTNGNASPSFAGSAGKIGAAHLFRHRS